MIPGKLLVICGIVTLLASCNFEACDTGVYPGLEVEVRDRATGEFMTATPRGVAREGAFEDSLEVSGFSTEVPPRVAMMAGWVPVGRYTVHLAADGYEAWDTAGVQVREGDCGLVTTSITASLQPAP